MRIVNEIHQGRIGLKRKEIYVPTRGHDWLRVVGASLDGAYREC